MKSIIKKLSYFSITAGSLLTPIAVHANQYAATLDIRRTGDVGVSSVQRLINAGFTTAVIIAALFVFVMLIMGGYAWITAGGDKAKVEEARGRITNAIIGLAIVAAAWALMIIIGNFFGVSIQDINIPSAAVGDDFGGS